MFDKDIKLINGFALRLLRTFLSHKNDDFQLSHDLDLKTCHFAFLFPAGFIRGLEDWAIRP